MMDRPAFPASLPPKPAVSPPRPAAMPNNASSSASDATGMSKIVIAFLVVMTLANLGLTFYFNQPKDVGVDSPTTAMLNAQQQEIAHLKDELVSVKGKLAVQSNELGRLKTDQIGLNSRVIAIPTPRALPYETLKAPLTTPNAGEQPQGDPK